MSKIGLRLHKRAPLRLSKQLPASWQQQARRRYLHSNNRHQSTSSPTSHPILAPAAGSIEQCRGASSGSTTSPPLSPLPLSTVIRTLCITTLSSSPTLLDKAITTLSSLAETKFPLLNPDRNIALRYLLMKTLYAQFCAGETPDQVKTLVRDVKELGFAGVILGYAPEIVLEEDQADGIGAALDPDSEKSRAEIDFWRTGMLSSVDLAGEGNFIALKFSGAGRRALRHLLRRLPPFPELEEATVEICERAKSRNVRLLFDAEQQAVQPAIDDWTISFQRRYNNGPDRRALVYGTYQAYLRSTPATLSRHLSIAQSEGFVLGVKLVRGAYLETEPRHLIWATKEETDNTYDRLAESLIKREYGEVLRPHATDSSSTPDQFPEVSLVLGTQNRDSVQHALRLRETQAQIGQPQIEMAYAQLYGMADELGFDLIHRAVSGIEKPKVYKNVVWGKLGECMKYLSRRAQENKDALSRTKDTRRAMAKELRRRMFEG